MFVVSARYILLSEYRMGRIRRGVKSRLPNSPSGKGEVSAHVPAEGARGIDLRSLTEVIDTTTDNGRMVFRIFAALAEFERGIIRERTMAGLEAAKARGRTGGRPPAMSEANITAARAMLRANGISVAEVAEQLRVSPSTLYRPLPGGRGAVG